MSEGKLQQPEPLEEKAPKSLEEVISGLKGFGIEEFEEILTLNAGGKEVKLRISNIPSSDEMSAVLACEKEKGYIWVQRAKCEILSRAITWIDGVSLRTLEGVGRIVTDPTDKAKKDVQVALRNVILGWGREISDILWKVVCVHSQRIEDRLAKSFPDSAIMTEVEKRFLENAIRDIEDANKERITEQFKGLVDVAAEEQAAEETTTQE